MSSWAPEVALHEGLSLHDFTHALLIRVRRMWLILLADDDIAHVPYVFFQWQHRFAIDLSCELVVLVKTLGREIRVAQALLGALVVVGMCLDYALIRSILPLQGADVADV